MRIAVLAVTGNGVKIGARINERLNDDVEVFVPPQSSRKKPWIMELTADIFPKYDALVFISAVGIAVRAIAPHLKDKMVDPAVVVVDDAGAFSISLVSGHIGGANDLARKIADAVGAMPVITTATDLAGKPAIDLMMKELGLRTDDKRALTRVSSGILRGESACIFADISLGRWGDRTKAAYSVRPLKQLSKYGNIYDHIVIIENDEPVKPGRNALILKPRRVYAGIGFRKEASSESIKKAIRGALAGQGLHPHNIKGIATIDIKKDDEQLDEVARHCNLRVFYYPAERLDEVAPNISEFVKDKVGAGGVCEPAAILASKGGKLIVPKEVYGDVTVALAEEAY